MQSLEAIKLIRNEMFEKKITVTKISSELGLNSSTLSRFLNRKSEISHSKFLSILDYLDIRINSAKEFAFNDQDLELLAKLKKLNPARKALIFANIKRKFDT